MKRSRADLERILTLVPTIAAHPGISVTELARRCGSGITEVHDDLARILMCGVPPYLPSDYILVDLQGDRVYLDFAERFARPVSLLVEEALALRLALANLEPMVGEAGSVVTGLKRKIEQVLSARDPEALDAADRIDVDAARGERAILRQLGAAISARCAAQICYYTAARGTLSDRIIWPSHFVEDEGVLYVHGFCSLRQSERRFRVDRIRTLELGPEVEARAENVSAAQASTLAAALPAPEPMEVVIRFDAEVARFVSERFVGVQIDSNTGAATLRVPVEYPEWLYGWVLTFGRHAELLSPPAARAGFARHLDRILARHE